MKDEAAVSNMYPDYEAINSISEEYDLIGYYIFTEATRMPGRDAGTRMFAPRFGIKEEAATGMAAGPLACFLYDKMKRDKNIFVIEQGNLMTPVSPSVITVKLTLTNQKINTLMAGGEAKTTQSMTVSI